VTVAGPDALSRVALCVCTRNRPTELQRALTSVTTSSMRPAQTLVSDDSDDDLQPKILAVCEEFPFVTYAMGPRRGLSANRNNCLACVSRDIETVLFIDDDVVLPREFLTSITDTLRRAPERTIVTGYEYRDGYRVIPHNCSFWGHQEREPQDPGDVHAICINATAFPRALFDFVRFDEQLRYGSDEIDLCARAEQVGFRVLFDPALFVYHQRSPVNRTEYIHFRDASRIYTTYKRYRWIEKRRGKAALYALVAPAHLLASVAMHRRRTSDLRLALHAIRTARNYVQAYRSSTSSSRNERQRDRSEPPITSAAEET
jgi:GT2 family glycosyltransferase